MSDVTLVVKPSKKRQLRISAAAFDPNRFAVGDGVVDPDEEDLWIMIESVPADKPRVVGAGQNCRNEAWIKLHVNNYPLALEICRAINRADTEYNRQQREQRDALGDALAICGTDGE